MFKKQLSCILFFFFLTGIHAQDKKHRFHLTPNVNEHELYVSFSPVVHFTNQEYLKTLLKSVQGIKEIDKEFHMKFEKGIALSDDKLDYLENEAIRNSKNPESVKKLRNYLKVNIDNPTNERLVALATKLEELKEVEYCELLSIKPIESSGKK